MINCELESKGMCGFGPVTDFACVRELCFTCMHFRTSPINQAMEGELLAKLDHGT